MPPKGKLDPDKLSTQDRHEYDRYIQNHPAPAPSWADGSPRNPMVEIRHQNEADMDKAREQRRKKHNKAKAKSMVEKRYAKGGAVRGCGIAKKGVRKAKMR